jgi:molecular chaperone Hsp33
VSDELVRTTSADGELALRAVVGTDLVAEAVRRHRTAPTSTAALGRGLLGGVLLAAGRKGDERWQFELRGDGPIRSLLVIAEADGRVRGRVSRSDVALRTRDGESDVAGAIGRGLLAVVRSHPAWREPYRGIVPIATGGVASDLAAYLRDSEQVPAAMALGVALGPGGAVAAAGGYLVEALPGARDASLASMESRVRELPAPTALLAAGCDADAMLDRLLGPAGGTDRIRLRPTFACPCDRARALRSVALLGPYELASLAALRESVELRCELCAERYEIPVDEALAFLESGADPR